MLRTISSLAAVALAVLLPTAIAAPANATVVDTLAADMSTDFSYFGARTLAPGNSAAYVTVGLPDAEFGMTFGLNSVADVTPRARIQYGRGGRVGGIGFGMGTQLRMKVARGGGWTAAIVGEPELAVHMFGEDHPPTTTTGLPSIAFTPLSAGIVADKQVLSDVRLVAGLKVPVTFYLRPEWIVNVPIIAELGVESHIADNVVLLTRFDAGADFYGPGGLPSTHSYFRLRAGIGWGQ